MTNASTKGLFLRIAGPALAALILAACAAAPTRAPDTHYELDASIPPVSFGVNGSVMLRRVDVRGLQSGRSLITVIGENPMRFQEQRGHFWHVATPTLVERSMLTAFNSASSDLVFGTADSLDKPDYRMIVTVTRFAYDPDGEAMVNFDATVTAAGGDVVLARSYWGRAPLADPSPSAGVTAIGAALGEAMTVFSSELAAAF